jgi:hypothetical protein
MMIAMATLNSQIDVINYLAYLKNVERQMTTGCCLIEECPAGLDVVGGMY